MKREPDPQLDALFAEMLSQQRKLWCLAGERCDDGELSDDMEADIYARSDSSEMIANYLGVPQDVTERMSPKTGQCEHGKWCYCRDWILDSLMDKREPIESLVAQMREEAELTPRPDFFCPICEPPHE